MKVLSSILIPLFLLFSTCLGQTAEQNSEAKVLGGTEYRLPASAEAKGIDGKLPIGLNINADGKASDVRIYGGPMWPCGEKEPKSEIEEVRRTVKEHILKSRFTPEIKDGKPRSVSAEIVFFLTDKFEYSNSGHQTRSSSNSNSPFVIDVGMINNRAVSLPRPFYTGPKAPGGITQLQILVDETGNVTSAGGYKGHPPHITAARDAACKANFKPAVLNGKPVRMTGILTYIFR